MIEVKELTKYYGPTLAIRQLNFEIADGEIVGFLGPNAAGKTTTLKILAGYMPPSSGTATINGYDCLTQPLEVRQSLGYLPENVPLYRDLDVTQFLTFAARAKGVEGRQQKTEIDRAIVDCGLENVRHTLIASLSKGYRQRLGLAQALLNRPPLLILDEPTIGLDPSQIVEIRQLIKDLAGNHTVFLSSHILPEVSQLCQRVIIINRGQIVASDTPANLTRQLGESARLAMVVKGPEDKIVATLKVLPGIRAVTASGNGNYLLEVDKGQEMRPTLARQVVQAGWDLLELRAQEFTLEDVFLNLVTEEENKAA
ncbi:MAG: ATP-binding cassette domain-containing protein [Deltaproteobacteria bacterium]|nr:ATP-binding cassette domain-containing protein [Deltaproteobacteria bacterium]MBW1952478.1 ATP-binding cassette domain-containing protein [Deltaproteobacteria bacterium]MBW1987407.1 ATP-binding cassette domain-containing protein [Deltaproteobacteria bacterium]MBW2135190.1 ATP-binding cassette domain-containing protein [Deltaproteobacteria bacterium]